MNLFVLDSDVRKYTQHPADLDVSKMFPESEPMLGTVLNQLGVKIPYRSMHLKHPCTAWSDVLGSTRSW